MARWLSLFPGQGRGLLKISQMTFTEKTVNQFRLTTGRNTSLSSDVLLDELDDDESDRVLPFRELAGSLKRLANQKRPGISNAVRVVPWFARVPKRKHWKAARGILLYLKVTSS